MSGTQASKPQQPQKPGFAAGSEGWDGSEDPSRPVASSDENNASSSNTGAADREAAGHTTQSDYALSGASEEGQENSAFSVAEEQNMDAQSQSARKIGQMPPEAQRKPQ